MLLKEEVVSALYKIYRSSLGDDIDAYVHIMQAYLKHKGIGFKSVLEDEELAASERHEFDVSTTFFEAINSELAYNSLPHFKYLCEQYIEFTPRPNPAVTHYEFIENIIKSSLLIPNTWTTNK